MNPAELIPHKNPESRTAQLDALMDLISLWARKGLNSPATQRTYRMSLRRYLAFLAQRRVSPANVSARVAAQYRTDLTGSGARRASVNLHLSVARQLHDALISEAEDNGHTVRTNPFTRVQQVGGRDAPPAPYSPAEINTLISGGGRAALTVLLGAHAGLRRAEIAGLRPQDIDFSRMELNVLGKGNHRRRVPMSDRLALALKQHLPHVSGTTVLGISPDTVAHDLERHCAKLNVTYRGVHSLRRAAAVKLHQQTGSLQAVQRHLGHASVSTTSRYTFHDDQGPDLSNW